MKTASNSLLAQASDIVRAAGIDNFHIEGGALVICGQRYFIEPCSCDDPACNGLSLCEEDGGPLH